MLNELEFRAAMVRRGYTQKALAAELGMSSAALGRRIHSGNFKLTEVVKVIDLQQLEDPEKVFFS